MISLNTVLTTFSALLLPVLTLWSQELDFTNAEASLTSSVGYFADTTYVMWPGSRDHEEVSWHFADWDNRSFNPYKEQDLKEAFELHFDKSYYASPTESKMTITSRYGWRNGQLHRGIDIDLRSGDDVYAMLDGKVRFVKHHGGHGRTVVLRHQNGLETVYAHLSKQLVKENDVVTKGQIIGKGGTTGNARGSHLHLEVRYKGVTINPEYIFVFDDTQAIRFDRGWITDEIANPRHFSSVRKRDLPIITDLEKWEARKEAKKSNQKATHPSDHRGPYVIKKGDTLYSLSRRFKVSIDDICRINKIADRTKIKVGQRISFNF